MLTSTCGHSFCLVCISEYRRHSTQCPICLENIDWATSEITKCGILIENNGAQSNSKTNESNSDRKKLKLEDPFENEHIKKPSCEVDGQIALSEDTGSFSSSSLPNNQQNTKQIKNFARNLTDDFFRHVKKKKEKELEKISKELFVINTHLTRKEEVSSVDCLTLNQENSFQKQVSLSSDSIVPEENFMLSSPKNPVNPNTNRNSNDYLSDDRMTQNCPDSKSNLDKFKKKWTEIYSELEFNLFDDNPAECIQEIAEDLCELPSLECVASFNQYDPSLNTLGTTNLISALELDDSDRMLATAGVSRKIQIYDLQHILSSSLNSKSNHSLRWYGDEDDEKDSDINHVCFEKGSSHRSLSARLRRRSTFSRQYSNSSLFSALHDKADSNYLGSSRIMDNSMHDPSNLDFLSSNRANGSLSNKPVTPLLDIFSKTKFSSLSWNKVLNKHQLASADYEGLIQIWDTTTGQLIAKLEEHDKRAWTVEFSTTENGVLASGSDDCRVKIWSLQQKRSTMTIPTKASVCSVAFCPNSSNYVSFGSADHSIYCYDLRNLKTALVHLTGHAKSVSYVKYVNANTLVSASTDSTLHTWALPLSSTPKDHAHTIPSPSQSVGDNKVNDLISSTIKLKQTRNDSRNFPSVYTSSMSSFVPSSKFLNSSMKNVKEKVYQGHVNEKNFVGLAVNNESKFFACGSEDNCVYVYSKHLSKPWMTKPIGISIDFITGRECPENGKGQFVSAVTWGNKQSDLLIAGNSAGRIKIYNKSSLF